MVLTCFTREISSNLSLNLWNRKARLSSYLTCRIHIHLKRRGLLFKLSHQLIKCLEKSTPTLLIPCYKTAGCTVGCSHRKPNLSKALQHIPWVPPALFRHYKKGSGQLMVSLTTPLPLHSAGSKHNPMSFSAALNCLHVIWATRKKEICINWIHE